MCHLSQKIDPIGFGLENFDPIGKWRELEYAVKVGTKRKVKSGAGRKIDPSGAFHKGPAFADYFAMRELIADREEDFAEGFTEHLVAYALGRPVGFTDQGEVRKILTAARSEEFKVSTFIQALVNSPQFQQK